MKKIKITVLKTNLAEDLAKQYGAEGIGRCPMFQEGQVFYADNTKPAGFCDEAWAGIFHYAFSLVHGAGKETFYSGEWVREPGVAIACCNDGIRPVTFKIEATDEDC